MLGKMILQGLGAAAIVATAASFYSASAQTGTGAAAPVQATPAARADTGYLSAESGRGVADQTQSRRSHHDDDDDDDDDDRRHHRDHHESRDRDGRR